MRRYLATSKSSTENSPEYSSNSAGRSSINEFSKQVFDQQSKQLAQFDSSYFLERLGDDKMAVTVLPTGGSGLMMNDYYGGKYHSLSGGSAFCQAIRFAEPTWLYANPSSLGGSLHRPNFIRFDEEGEPVSINCKKSSRPRIPVVTCSCENKKYDRNRTVGRCGSSSASSSPSWICRRCGGRDIVGQNGSSQFFRKSDYDVPSPVVDPYDAVRQSRLAGLNGRAKSCSPTAAKRIELIAAGNRRTPSPDDVYGKTGEYAAGKKRRSILECDVNPYDLVGQSGYDEAALLGEEEASTGDKVRSKKQHRFSLREKFKSKIRESRTAKSIFENFKTTTASKKEEKEEGVSSIAGQRIRIFPGNDKCSENGGAGVVSCGNGWIVDNEDEYEVKESDDADDRSEKPDSEHAPRRPPRRKCKDSAKKLATTTTMTLSNSAASTNGATVYATPSAVIYEVKSILKKPTTSHYASMAVGDNGSNVGHNRGIVAGNNGNDMEGSETLAVEGTANGVNFYSDHNRRTVSAGTGRRKVKKQVQFKGTIEEIQDRTATVAAADTSFEDESGCSNKAIRSLYSAAVLGERNARSTIDQRTLSGKSGKPVLANDSVEQSHDNDIDGNDNGNDNDIDGNDNDSDKKRADAGDVGKRCNGISSGTGNSIKKLPSDDQLPLVRPTDDCSTDASTNVDAAASSSSADRLALQQSATLVPPTTTIIENDAKLTGQNSPSGFDEDSLNESSQNSRDSNSNYEQQSPSQPSISSVTIEDGFAAIQSSPIMMQANVCSHVAEPNLRPYLPPRQFFPFLPANSSVVNSFSCAHQNLYSVSQSQSTSEQCNRSTGRNIISVGTDEIEVPSLTRTFLQNKAAESAQKNSLKSVVVVSPPAAKQQRRSTDDSGADKCTIVVVSENRSSTPFYSNNQRKTSIRVGENENGSLAVPYSVNENKVTINIVADRSTRFGRENPDRRIVENNNSKEQQHVTSISLKSSVWLEQADLINAVKSNSVPHICSATDVNKQSTAFEHEPAAQSNDRTFDYSDSSSSDNDSLENERFQSKSEDDDDRPIFGDAGAGAALTGDLHYMSTEINDRTAGLSSDQQRHLTAVDEHIYEEISDVPPPLPKEPPPAKIDLPTAVDLSEAAIPAKSIFEGASKYDILNYLAVAKERCIIVPEEPEDEEFAIEESVEEDEDEEVADLLEDSSDHSRINSLDLSSRVSQISDSSEELTNLFISSGDSCSISSDKIYKAYPDIERNDSGVGSETSKCSRSKWQHFPPINSLNEDQHTCEDCEQPVEIQITNSGLMYAPLVCTKCSKKRIERREIICEIVETEEKYKGDLRIILDEFYRPMLVAGLLSPEQLSAIFLNVEELLENSTTMAEKLRDMYEIALEQGDEDLLTVNVAKVFLDLMPTLNAFESYCTRQGSAALLLSNLEKEKELLRIFLRVSQMENTVLRRMNLNSFLMVPVQRVTKYPLLLARLYKVTPEHQRDQRDQLKDAQHNIELHLEHINSLTKDISNTKLWRRISMMNGRRISGDSDDSLNFKLQRVVLEVLEWSHDEVRFVLEGRLFYAQPTDGNWKRSGRNIKVVPVNAVLVTLGKPTDNYNPRVESLRAFPRENGIKDASLLLLKEKSGRYSLHRDPMFLDRCIVCCDNISEEFFEIHEIPTKESYIFKAEDNKKTQQWYRQVQYHSQGLGCWRKRRNALANIMINGMQIRT